VNAPWRAWRRRPAETGEAQLARVRAATPPPADPPGPAADLPTQLAHLRAILELLDYYAYYRRGNLHADVAVAVGTPARPLTARRVALLHEADPADLGDLDAAELAQVAAVALRDPAHLAHDPAVVARAAANLDLMQAATACERHPGGLPAVRPDPDLTSSGGQHAYAAALRRAVRRRHPDAVWDNPQLNWGRRADGPPGPPPSSRPVARAAVIAELAGILPLLWATDRIVPGERSDAALAALAAPGALGEEFAAWAVAANRERGFAYHFRGSLGSANWPFYLGDAELDKAIRQVRARHVDTAPGAR